MSAGQVCYTQRRVELQDQVVIEGQIGRLECERALLMGKGWGKDKEWSQVVSSPSRLYLYDDIFLSFHDGGTLSCGKADLHLSDLSAAFFCTIQQPLVTYDATNLDRHGDLIPIHIEGERMQVQLLSGQGEGEDTLGVQEILAEYSVRICYGSDFQAETDQARYERRRGGDTSSNPYSGVITLSPFQGKECVMTFSEHHKIYAKEVHIDCMERVISFFAPHGEFVVVTEEGVAERLSFEAESLIWNSSLSSLRLKGGVRIQHRGLGTLVNQDEMILLHEGSQFPQSIRSIESLGYTCWTYCDPNVQAMHTLECQGRVFWDCKAREGFLESPQSCGRISKGKQVHYVGPMGEMYTDLLRLFYDSSFTDLPSFCVSKVQLTGHVRLKNKTPLDPNQDHSVRQYALADQLVILPSEHLMTLSCMGDRRVLFYDEINQIQMSAPGIEIFRTKTPQQESVRGLGNVRFSFREHEIKSIAEHFQLFDSQAAIDVPLRKGIL